MGGDQLPRTRSGCRSYPREKAGGLVRPRCAYDKDRTGKDQAPCHADRPLNHCAGRLSPPTPPRGQAIISPRGKGALGGGTYYSPAVTSSTGSALGAQQGQVAWKLSSRSALCLGIDTCGKSLRMSIPVSCVSLAPRRRVRPDQPPSSGVRRSVTHLPNRSTAGWDANPYRGQTRTKAPPSREPK